MASKQGGKGKSSSPSRSAYHKRAPSLQAAHKARKLAQHCARSKTSITKLTAAGGLQTSREYGKTVKPLVQRVVFSETHRVPRPHTRVFLKVHAFSGVLCDIGFSPIRAEKDFLFPVVSPLTGRVYSVHLE